MRDDYPLIFRNTKAAVRTAYCSRRVNFRTDTANRFQASGEAVEIVPNTKVRDVQTCSLAAEASEPKPCRHLRIAMALVRIW